MLTDNVQELDARHEAINTVHRTHDLMQLERQHPLLEFKGILTEMLEVEWRSRQIIYDEGAFEHDINVLVNRARGFGVLAEHIPPARTDLSDLAFHADGRMWVRYKGDRKFQEVEGDWNHSAIDQAINGGLLRETGKALTEADVSVDAKISGELFAPDGRFIGRRPLARIKAHHRTVTAGMQYPSLSLRFYEAEQVTPERVRGWKMAPDFVLDRCMDWVHQMHNVVICGGTGIGKTTFLSCLAHALEDDTRIITIEDPAELWLPQPQVQTLEARIVPQGNSTLKSLTVAHCVDDALRMNPHYLIVGEVRHGDAAMTLFRAFMSDHPGMTTFHAAGPTHALNRLQLIMQADAGVDPSAVPSLVHEALHVLIQLGWVHDEETGKPKRAVISISQPVLMGRMPKDELINNRERYSGLESMGVIFKTLWHHERFPDEVLPLERNE